MKTPVVIFLVLFVCLTGCNKAPYQSIDNALQMLDSAQTEMEYSYLSEDYELIASSIYQLIEEIEIKGKKTWHQNYDLLLNDLDHQLNILEDLRAENASYQTQIYNADE